MVATTRPARWGVYLHFPFCRLKCPYCDFNVRVGWDARIPRYAGALAREVGLRARALPAGSAGTVYLGGGTPSLLPPDPVGRILSAVDAAFPVERGAEITLEVNPGTVSPDDLAGYRRIGVNRLSIGVQSLDPVGLRALGRDHGVAEARRCVEDALGAGFSEVSIDLVYGWEGQTPAAWRQDLDAALSLGARHLSLYNLTVEERTELGARARRGRLRLPSEAAQATMYRDAARAAARVGFVHYEVSSFARPGAESRHNRLYWDGSPYVGAGAGAHGFDPSGGPFGRRWWNVRAPQRYAALCEGGGLPEAGSERPTAEQAALEQVLTEIRTREGLDLAAFEARFGPVEAHSLEAVAERLRSRRLVRAERGAVRRVRLTERGMILGDYAITTLTGALSAP